MQTTIVYWVMPYFLVLSQVLCSCRLISGAPLGELVNGVRNGDVSKNVGPCRIPAAPVFVLKGFQ